MEKLLLRVPEAAEIAGIGRSKAYEMVHTGEWLGIRIGRCIRIHATWLRDWVDQQLAKAVDEAQDSLH